MILTHPLAFQFMHMKFSLLFCFNQLIFTFSNGKWKGNQKIQTIFNWVPEGAVEEKHYKLLIFSWNNNQKLTQFCTF